MGASLGTIAAKKSEDTVTLSTMRAVTGCSFRYEIEEHKTWELKRVKCGNCSLCNDNNKRATWREVVACGHRFHRSCLRDHRRDHEPKCPTCDVSYSETFRQKVAIATGEMVDNSSWVTAGNYDSSPQITYCEITKQEEEMEMSKSINDTIQSSSDEQTQKSIVTALQSALFN